MKNKKLQALIGAIKNLYTIIQSKLRLLTCWQQAVGKTDCADDVSCDCKKNIGYITNELIETYIWFFDTNEGYGRERFICIAKNNIDVLKLYKHSKEYPIIFDNQKLKTIRLDNQLILIKKIKIFNTENQVIYDTNYGSD